MTLKITEPSFDEAEIESLRECLSSGWVTQGPMTERFERLIAEKQSVKHALATTSCTAALHLAAMALDLKADDEVIVPAFTWITSANCAEYVGAKVVFADIDIATFNLSLAAFKAAISPRTKAVVAVHLFGLAAPMNEIISIARHHNIAIIEDAACALGTTYEGKLVGSLGDVGCFSFHPRKVITTGEGGAVTTSRDDLAEKVKSLRNHGATGLPDKNIEEHGPWTMAKFEMLGFNLRMSDIQAAVGVVQVGKLDGLLAERRSRARRYTELLDKAPGLALPVAGDIGGHSFQSYVIRVLDGGRAKRNRIMQSLQDADIQSRPGTHAVHTLGYYSKKYNLKPDDFPNATLAENTSITLPIFPKMTDEQQDFIVDVLTEAAKSL